MITLTMMILTMMILLLKGTYFPLCCIWIVFNWWSLGPDWFSFWWKNSSHYYSISKSKSIILNNNKFKFWKSELMFLFSCLLFCVRSAIWFMVLFHIVNLLYKVKTSTFKLLFNKLGIINIKYYLIAFKLKLV